MVRQQNPVKWPVVMILFVVLAGCRQTTSNLQIRVFDCGHEITIIEVATRYPSYEKEPKIDFVSRRVKQVTSDILHLRSEDLVLVQQKEGEHLGCTLYFGILKEMQNMNDTSKKRMSDHIKYGCTECAVTDAWFIQYDLVNDVVAKKSRMD